MKSQTFGEKIKNERLKNAFSLKYVGSQINYRPNLLSKVEKNLKEAPLEIILPLSKVLKVSYKDLMIKYLSEKIYYLVKNKDFANEAIRVSQNRLKKDRKGTQELKKIDEIINLISSYFKTKPVEKAWLFGSFARNSSISYDSDIDILVEFKKPNKVSLFDLIEMKSDLYDKLGREIDLVEKGQELKSFQSEINNEKLLVYEK